MARVTDCPHAQLCGGCPLIELSYEDQLARKHARVAAAFARFPLLAAVPVAPALPAEPATRYRTRTKLVVGPEGIGLYGGGGHALVDLPECRVLPEDLAAVVARLREYLREGAAHAHSETQRGLRGVDLRGAASGEAVLVTLIVDDDADARAEAEAIGARLAKDEPRVAGVFVAPHAGESPRLLAPGAYRVAGRDRLEDRVGETVYVAGPGAFVQAHRGQAARVHAAVTAHVVRGADARVLDLYAGGGGIGLSLARAGARVTLVESYAPAVEDARASAARNGVQVDTLAADAEGALDELWDRRAGFEAVVLNPPRRGCTPAVREKVARLKPERIAYVSCDPETLARDLDHLRRLGYATQSASPLDMIPLTDEVETVALLTRAPAPHPPILGEDDALLAIAKWPNEPLTPHPGRATSTLARVRRRAAWAEAAPFVCPDEQGSGVCVFLRSGALLREWQREPAETSVLVLVRGVTHEGGTVARRGAPPLARYKRLAVAGGQSLLRLTVRGATPQALRESLAAMGHPVVGDERSGHAPTNRHVAERHGLTRAFVHVERVTLSDPGGATREFTAPLAPDLAVVLARMGAREVGEQLSVG